MSELERYLVVPEDRAEAAGLLHLLRRRWGIAEDVADEIESLDLGVGHPDFNRWESLINFIRNEQCTPVLGLGLTDTLIGPRRSFTRHWAERYNFPMARHQRDDLPQVAQYVAVENGDGAVRSALGEYLRQQIRERFPASVPRDEGPGHLDDMIEKAWRCERLSMDPHLLLARLPVAIYVTAHPSRLLDACARASWEKARG